MEDLRIECNIQKNEGVYAEFSPRGREIIIAIGRLNDDKQLSELHFDDVKQLRDYLDQFIKENSG